MLTTGLPSPKSDVTSERKSMRNHKFSVCCFLWTKQKPMEKKRPAIIWHGAGERVHEFGESFNNNYSDGWTPSPPSRRRKSQAIEVGLNNGATP